MKVNIIKDSGNWISSFVFHAMTELTATTGKTDFIEVFKIKQDDGGFVDVCVTINGVEIPVESFFSHLQKHHSTFIRKEALSIIDSSFNKISDTLYKLESYAKNKLMDDVLPAWEKQHNEHNGPDAPESDSNL